MRKILFTILFLLFASVAYAAPTISSVSIDSISDGTITDGQTGITITDTGNGFGSKPSGPPVMWDTFENGTDTANADVHTPDAGTYGTWSTDLGGGTNKPVINTSVVKFGSKASKHDFTTTGQYTCGLAIKNVAYNDYIVSFWRRVDHGNMTAYNGVAPSRNEKPYRATGSNTTSYSLGTPLLAFERRLYANPAKEIALRGRDGSNNLATDTDYHTLGWGNGTWQHVIHVVKTGANGFFREYYNAVADGNASGVESFIQTEMNDGTFDDVLFGYYYSRDQGASAYAYLDNIYVDSTVAHIEITDASEYESPSVTKRAIQIPTSWTTGSITFDANLEGMTGTVYLYVIDSSGTISDNNNNISDGYQGYPVVVGAGGTDTTPPYVINRSPANGATAVSVNTDIVFDWLDSDNNPNIATLDVKVEASSKSFTYLTISGGYTITVSNANAGGPFAEGQVVNVTVDGSDDQTNAMTQDAWSFTTEQAGSPAPESYGGDGLTLNGSKLTLNGNTLTL